MVIIHCPNCKATTRPPMPVYCPSCHYKMLDPSKMLDTLSPPTFTDKHTDAIAQAINDTKANCYDADHHGGIVILEMELAEMLAADNPKFDSEAFTRACKRYCAG